MSGIQFRSLLEISDLNSLFKTGSNCWSIVGCSTDGRPTISVEWNHHRTFQIFARWMLVAERFAPARRNVCRSRCRGAGGLAYHYHRYFLFFSCFCPPNRSASLKYYTNFYSADSVVFFSTSPYTTATKSDHRPRQTTALSLSLSSFVWRRIRNQRMTCNAVTTVFPFNLNDCRSLTPRGLYNNVRSGRRFPHLSGKRSDVRCITTIQLCR